MGSGITNISNDSEKHGGLLVLLNRTGQYEEAGNYAIKILEIRKKAAQTSANREARAEQALSVWACANGSGSIKLLRETLQWAKRFIRDQLTASKLFSAYYDETYRLLSGFPVHGIPSLNARDLRLQVEAANAFLMDVIDVAREGLRKPSFRPSDWREMIDSFTPIIKLRIELSAELKRGTTLSDEDIYSSLWKDTVAMLLRAERLLNSEEYEKLGAATMSGVVMWRAVFPRNAHTPFPRGLPVQHLLASWSPDVLELDESAPYVSSRVQEILFAAPERSLKPIIASKSLMPAIGNFVDSYPYALTTYIPQDCDKQVKQARLLKAWNYATGPLSLVVERKRVLAAGDTCFDEPSQTQDWNPLEGRPSHLKIEARKLTEPTYVDFCTNGQQARNTKPYAKAINNTPKPCIPAEYHSAPGLWSPSEAFTLAALLVLDAKYGTTSGLLAEPFSSSSDVRFPCVFLDEEFLSSAKVKSSDATFHITNNLANDYVDVPLPLVHRMTAVLVGKLVAKATSRALEATALGLLKALA
ncbi:hypothetical protein E8E11_002305 [Didymella keratinophila]|nr:hypothetical protein E8E11_002305 [Didymella keratinophila]